MIESEFSGLEQFRGGSAVVFLCVSHRHRVQLNLKSNYKASLGEVALFPPSASAAWCYLFPIVFPTFLTFPPQPGVKSIYFRGLELKKGGKKIMRLMSSYRILILLDTAFFRFIQFKLPLCANSQQAWNRFFSFSFWVSQMEAHASCQESTVITSSVFDRVERKRRREARMRK